MSRIQTQGLFGPVAPFASADPEGFEERLVSDGRAEWRPSQAVEQKLALLLKGDMPVSLRQSDRPTRRWPGRSYEG